MPLDLDPMSINQYSGVPLHRQLADHVRAAIADGRLAPGETLPTELELAAMAGMSRDTVRRSLDTLAVEGRIVKRSGMPARVAAPVSVRHMATSRYQAALDRLRGLATPEDHPLTSAFTEDHGVAWDEHSIQADYSVGPATVEDMQRLHLTTSAPVLRRQLIKVVREVPVQIQHSVIPLELVEDTAVADPERQPWPGGTIAELYSVGLVVSHVSEEASARAPEPDERRMLRMEAAGWVWDIVRRFYVDQGARRRPVEASVVVCPVASIVLAYETDLT